MNYFFLIQDHVYRKPSDTDEVTHQSQIEYSLVATTSLPLSWFFFLWHRHLSHKSEGESLLPVQNTCDKNSYGRALHT